MWIPLAKQIYRKALLERMSSPDQLDKMIVITPPAFWLALLGGTAIVIVTLVWSILGHLPMKLDTSGIFVSDQMAFTLASDTGGIVSTLEVEIGDTVEEGDVLLTLADESVQRELTTLLDRRAKVEAVTLTSVNDVVTADNRDLINLKTQLGTSGSESSQNRAMLAVYQAELAALRPKVSAAKAEMEAARESYYAYIGSGTDSQIELDFSEAQANYNQQSSVLASAEASYSNAKSSYRNAVQSVKRAVLSSLDAALDAAQDDEALVDELTALKNKVNGISNSASPSSFEFLLSESFGGAPLLDGASYSQLQNLYSQYQSAEEIYDDASSAHSAAERDYEEAKEAYTDYADGRAEMDAEKERLGTLYNQLNSDYNALYSQQTSLQANITSIEGQLRASNVGSAVQRNGYVEQFEATRSALLDGLDAEIEKYQYNLEKNNIRATVSGNVTDIKVGVGAAVGQGAEIVTIRQLSEENHIICYIPISSGKKVAPGMEVIVTPTTVNRQEYGHMKAEVVTVDNYVTPASSIRATLGDDTLAQAFTQNGPVVAVTCRLRTDETTASGYWWSSRKGADLIVPEGTLVTADIITEEKAPITMLIPYIKEKLTMAVEPGAGEKEGQ